MFYLQIKPLSIIVNLKHCHQGKRKKSFKAHPSFVLFVSGDTSYNELFLYLIALPVEHTLFF